MQAASACHTFGMQLARFDSAAEQNHLIAALKGGYGATYFWLAGNDIEYEGIWKWAPDDTPTATGFHLAWKAGRPVINRGLNCLCIQVNLYPLIDLNCKSSYNFICEREYIK
jgi:hypothetical protein